MRPSWATTSKLTFRKSAKGLEYAHVAPGALEKLGNYRGVMVDEPEVIISTQSEYKGAKPDDLKAAAEAMRQATFSHLPDVSGRPLAMKTLCLPRD